MSRLSSWYNKMVAAIITFWRIGYYGFDEADRMTREELRKLQEELVERKKKFAEIEEDVEELVERQSKGERI
jgi:hypothetical protein